MQNENKIKRQIEIETAAYELLDEFGYDGISMLKIAKRAKASNETLYRWYGDKLGLFKSLVKNNIIEVKEYLTDELNENKTSSETLNALGPRLLTILLSSRAIALNRAAASDPSGILGKSLAKHGRETIAPLVVDVFKTICQEKMINKSPVKLGELYIRLLIGDLQIRCVTGAIDVVTSSEIEKRSVETMDMMRQLNWL